jgi:predicted transcriptional regulator
MICFPSINKIAEDYSISRRTVQRVLTDLVDAGFIKRESRFHDKGGQRSNVFQILVPEVELEKVNLFENGKNCSERIENKRFSLLK